MSKNESWPDNVFITENMTNLLISCTVSEEQHIKTDHYRIKIVLNMEKSAAEMLHVKNWKMVDWKIFSEVLQQKLKEACLEKGPINTEECFTYCTDTLTKCLIRNP